MKKILVTLAIVLVSTFSIGVMASSPAHAAACKNDVDASFMSFPTWYRGLCKDGTNEIELEGMDPGNIIFAIALNIIDIALRLVGFLAIGYLIYGGFRYVTSRGSPEEVKKAQDIILKAVVGLVIAILATVIVSFVASSLGG